MSLSFGCMFQVKILPPREVNTLSEMSLKIHQSIHGLKSRDTVIFGTTFPHNLSVNIPANLAVNCHRNEINASDTFKTK